MQVIHWLAASFIQLLLASTVNGCFTTAMVSLPGSSQGGTRVDCGKMVVMALGGASARPRRVSGVVALLTYSSRDPQMDFALNHIATMSEMNG